MPIIKMKKGYPTSDGVMHDKHSDAVKRQCEIDFREMFSSKQGGVDAADVLENLSDNEADIVREWLKHTRKNVTTKTSAEKPAPKKKTAAKKPAAKPTDK